MCDEVDVDVIETYAVLPLSSTGRRRDLGGAILLAAIDDYCSLDEETHLDAQQFLYPQTEEWRDHYNWVVALAEGVNAAWLRDALDRYRGRWDAARFDSMVLQHHHRIAV